MAKHPISQTGHLKAYLSTEYCVRASVVVMTDIVKSLCDRIGASPTSAVALGRLLVGSVLVSSQLKEDQAISFTVSGSGQIRKVFAHSQYDGLCRGYISEKQAPLALEKNSLSIGPLIGHGLLQAMTIVPNQKAPQTTQVELQTGEIGDDIAYYLNQSCQIPCLVALGVKIGSEAQVVAAGGVLIELMPGHTEDVLAMIENQQSLAKPLSNLIEKGASHRDLLFNHLGDLDMDEVRAHDVHYGCTCSRDKAARSLQMLSSDDFKEIIKSQESLSVDCEMCSLVYSFLVEEMNMIYKKSGKAQVH